MPDPTPDFVPYPPPHVLAPAAAEDGNCRFQEQKYIQLRDSGTQQFFSINTEIVDGVRQLRIADAGEA